MLLALTLAKILIIKHMLLVNQKRNEFVVGFSGVRKLNITIREEVRKNILDLVDKTATKVVLNLQGIVFIDSAGFELLLEIEREAKLRGVDFQLMNVSEEVQEVIELVKLEDVFDIV